MSNYISEITLPNGNNYDLKDRNKGGVYPVLGTQTASTGSFTGVLHGVSELYTGLTISYYLPYAGTGNATLNLTLDDGTTTGAINCYYLGNNRLTTHYGAGNSIIMTYYKAGEIKVAGTATTDNRWICAPSYNSNDTGYYVRRIYPNIKAGANKIYPYTIIMQKFDGRWESLVTSNSTGTNKSRNTTGFILGNALLFYTNETKAENDAVSTYNIWQLHSGLIDHRYSFNTANNSTYGTIGYKPIYLVGTVNSSDGLFYLDNPWWTQTLPSAGSGTQGKIYIYIGDAYDYYRMTFVDTQKIYIYSNGRIREYTENAATVNGLTVQTAVPPNAVFTDTTYSAATTSVDGLMSATDKTKINRLQGIVVSATQPTNQVSGDIWLQIVD